VSGMNDATFGFFSSAFYALYKNAVVKRGSSCHGVGLP